MKNNFKTFFKDEKVKLTKAQETKNRKAIYEKLGTACQVCGDHTMVSQHHIIYRSRAPNHKYLHDIRNIWILCGYHHSMAHSNPVFNNAEIKRRELNKLFKLNE